MVGFFFKVKSLGTNFLHLKKEDPGINISMAILLVTSLLLKRLIPSQPHFLMAKKTYTPAINLQFFPVNHL